MKNEVKHTAHSSYRCEYHVVFAPNYRRKIKYRSLRKDIGVIFRKLCNAVSYTHLDVYKRQAIGDFLAAGFGKSANNL